MSWFGSSATTSAGYAPAGRTNARAQNRLTSGSTRCRCADGGDRVGHRAVIVSVHVATGAAAGALAGSRRRALLLGPALHLAADRIPHEGIPSRRFEIKSGLASVALLPRDAARSILPPSGRLRLRHLTSSTCWRRCVRAERSSFTAAAADTARARSRRSSNSCLGGAILGLLVAP